MNNEVARKRANGVYYTVSNVFLHKPFQEWAEKHITPGAKILEPFAGAMFIPRLLAEAGITNNCDGFDINPQAPEVQKRDTLQSFPTGYDVVITNPPYLAKTTATKKGFVCNFGNFDNLWKNALHQCLTNAGAVAVIIPASFLTSELYFERLEAVILLNYKVFEDTDCPVCLALFGPACTKDFLVYQGNEFIGKYQQFQQFYPICNNNIDIRFDVDDGQIGIKLCDNNVDMSNIQFVPGTEVVADKTTRGTTKVGIYNNGKLVDINAEVMLDQLNNDLRQWRIKTNDLFLTAFLGIRKDGNFRRRMPYYVARYFIENCADNYQIVNNSKQLSLF